MSPMTRRATAHVPRLPTLTLPPSGRWIWRQHGVALAVVLSMTALAILFPADYAAVFGGPAITGENAVWARSALIGIGLYVALVLRGHPWWQTVITLLICVGHSGQVVRGTFNPVIVDMPVSLVFLNLGILGYFSWAGIRPSVHEQLDASRAHCAEITKQLEAANADRWEQAGQIVHLQAENKRLAALAERRQMPRA